MTTRTARKTTNAKAAKAPRAPRVRTPWQRFCAGLGKLGNFLMARSRDIALMAIVGGAFVAVFDGSLYSATHFSFVGVSAIAFALMPDALMVISAAKMRQSGITRAQWDTAHRWMKIAMAFSLLTNMIAAFLRNCPSEWITWYVLLTGAVVYHGMIVIFLKGAVDVLTKTREDRKAKAHNTAEAAAAPVVAPVPVVTRPFAWTDTAMAWLINGKTPQA